MIRFCGIIYGYFSYIGRRKTFYLVLGLGVLFVLISGCFYSENITINQRLIQGENLIKVVRSITLYLSIFWGMILGILIGISTATGEVENRHIELVLSKPITRTEYILARLLTAFIISFSITLVMSIISWVIYTLRLNVFDLRIFLGIGISALDIALIVSFVTLISLILPRLLAGFVGLMTYFFSFITGIDFLKGFVLSEDVPTFTKIIARIIYIIVPPFTNIHKIANSVMNRDMVSRGEFSNLIHGVLYLIICLFLIISIFRRKEF
ncbi:MAG: hypothetical protein DRH51_03650 [Candidatus Coatesbacteria bacterium]|nr:MAG: hypothetical protein DRH51_03650 [Candidatus Coatesbacteria bacterium]RLC42176.1 MAG: hypothetical protein DRH49_04230 [Candidatus Coatesbacteria bacterium]RLC44906.1 MAG: hypothetical protein DRH44_00750 [Candidatus Coatesbacteria bacterium]